MGFLIVQKDWTILNANTTACSALGYEIQELKGAGLQQLLPFDTRTISHYFDADARRDSLKIVPMRMKNGSNYLAEIQFVRADSETNDGMEHFCLMFRASSVSDSVHYLMDTLQDNLFQFQGEAMFRAVAEMIGRKLEIEYVVIGEISAGTENVESKIIWNKDAFLESETVILAGSPHEAVVEQGEFLYFGPEAMELFPDAWQVAGWNVQAYFGIPLFNPERKIIGILAVQSEKPLSRDPVIELVLRMYADRLAAEMQRSIDERALRESEERFRRLYEHSPLAIGIRDLETEKVVDVNPRMLELFGFTPEEAIGSHRGATTVMEDDLQRQAFSEQLIKGEIPRFTTEKIYRTKGGSEIYCRSTRSLMRIDNKDYMIGILEDITKEKRVEAELREKIRELDQKNQQLNQYIESNLQLENFAYLASHDLKEPLRTIGSFSQLLERRYAEALGKDGGEYIGFIVQGVRNMNRLINDLLSYAQVNHKDHVWEKINPRHLLCEVLTDLEKTISETGSIVEIGSLPDSILGYKTNLRQLFQNLIANGIKFREKNRTPVIWVSCRPMDNGWRFEVSDNGIGIDPRFQDQIFSMFRRLHSRDEYEGTGIGLALCKRIVNQHGGEIEVHSLLGEGATFRFSLLNDTSRLLI